MLHPPPARRGRPPLLVSGTLSCVSGSRSRSPGSTPPQLCYGTVLPLGSELAAAAKPAALRRGEEDKVSAPMSCARAAGRRRPGAREKALTAKSFNPAARIRGAHHFAIVADRRGFEPRAEWNDLSRAGP
jgi:hypothetical protein